ncbi:MAG TPA: EAL domain-containing protein [Mogibacterium sp.]|nr:EAL domain-containing protein [Mogibacterium sp.]
MKYSLLVSTFYYICGFFYMVFGTYTVAANAKSKTNRLFLLITSSMAIWSFAYSISNSAPTAESSAFWRCMTVFGWSFFHSFLLHFAFILTKTEKRLNNRIMFIMLYLPTLINIILFAPFGLLAEKQYEMVPSVFGWRNSLSANIGQIWINIYYITYTVITFMLLIRWWKKIGPDTPLKRYVTYFLISMTLPFVMGSITDILPGILGFVQMPKLTLLFLILPTIFLFITLRKFGVLIERTKVEFISPDSVILSEENRLRLFETAAAIFAIGAASSFYSGYFIGGENIASELLLAFLVINLGIFLRFIPHITKKHKIQDTLFLITSIVGMTFFIIKDINVGGATVWSVYIIFLLYTVVLNSDTHAALFLGATLVTQVLLWIIYPNVSFTIDNSQYLKRIFVIVLSYVAVRYLTNEYDSKLRGYHRFSKEQETLEKISTKFISINNENAKEKIGEMFEMAAGILNYDSAYLLEFDAEYENATIINTYIKDIDVTTNPFYTGTKFKTADFPEVKPLITQNQPILCEDVTNVLDNEAENQRDFFASRGINSFYALPITAGEKPYGFFIVEYIEKSDTNFTESRLNFLRIIANILGDTRKKVLYEERIYNYAYFDEATKLANRNMLKKTLDEIIYNRKESEKLVIFDVELDNLRMINDTFGHNTGEQIVIESASILKNLMKKGCYISRIGEGKFVVVMPLAETIEQIEECANKIVDAFSDPILPKDRIEALFVSPAIGIAVYPDDGIDANTLLKNADLAGYEAKDSDNKIVFCSEQLKSRIAENTLLTNRLFHSMENDEFYLEFQPQISCKTEKTVGVEALLRWQYDNKKRISPDIFIPILEQTGLIHDVGFWVLEQALKLHQELIAKGLPPLRFSINVSVVQFQRNDFIFNFSRLLEESKVEPKYIEVEITETMMSKNFTDTIDKLFKLKELGISIAIDDFGRGYSSLHRLELVPFSRIKIDKTIVDDILSKKKKFFIVRTIISLAKNLMADITAEGVETKEQADFLKSMDCDEIQGYYYSKPLSPTALEEFLKRK